MPTPAEPAHEHRQFDALCAEIDEFENLPSVAARPAENTAEPDRHEELLDDQILGGLVSPY